MENGDLRFIPLKQMHEPGETVSISFVVGGDTHRVDLFQIDTYDGVFATASVSCGERSGKVLYSRDDWQLICSTGTEDSALNGISWVSKTDRKISNIKLSIGDEVLDSSIKAKRVGKKKRLQNRMSHINGFYVDIGDHVYKLHSTNQIALRTHGDAFTEVNREDNLLRTIDLSLTSGGHEYRTPIFDVNVSSKTFQESLPPSIQPIVIDGQSAR